MALESDTREKATNSLAAVCLAEEEKEREILPGYGEAQEKTGHHWSEAVD